MIQNQSQGQSDQAGEKLASELIAQRVSVQTKSVGMLGNFLTIAAQKTYEVGLNIIGDYRYRPRNEFSYNQKMKILSYLQAKVVESNAQLEDQKDTKFADYNPNFLAVLPDGFEQLRAKVLKGRTNVQAAQLSLQKLKYSRQHLAVRYINEQAYQFDHMKYNSLAWGFVIGALINATIYRRGSTVRKAALFVTSGHVFNTISHRYNIDIFFDSVYPIFQEEAVKFTKNQKEEFAGWKPEGKANIQE